MVAQGKEEYEQLEFDRIIHEFYRMVDSGKRVDRRLLIGKYPHFENELRSFFADLDNLEGAPNLNAADDTPKAGSLNGRTPAFPRGDSSLAAGATLEYIGEYRILGEIGRGGMGVVYHALQEKLKRPVALKMILTGRPATQADVERFHREARAAARLRHPNIVSVHEIGTHEGHPFYTMNLIEGESLADRLRETLLPPREAATLVKILAQATQHAHENEVLHRDLKPANVLIDRDGVPHITDFGLAKSMDAAREYTCDGLTQSGQILGTPGYMSPEQALACRDSIGVASDIYSLGAVLFSALSGRPPFVGDSLPEVLQRVALEDPPPIQILNPTIPKDLGVIAHKCLEKDPAARYPSALALAEDLDRYLRGVPILARPVGRFVRTWRWCKRNPAVASLACVATVAIFATLVVSSTFAFFYEQTARRERQQKLDAIEDLYQSSLAEAKSHRTSREAGRSVKSLAAIRRATKIRPSIELRSEAVVALSMVDLVREKTWAGFPQVTESVAFDADLERYAVGDTQGGVRVRRVSDDAELVHLPATGHTTNWMILEFSNRGEYLAVGYPGVGCWIWDLETRSPVLKIPHGEFISGFDFAPNDRELAIAVGEGTILIYDLATAQVTDTFDAAASVYDLRFSPDGSRLAATVFRKGLVQIFNRETQSLENTLRHRVGLTRRLCWHPDGESVVACIERDLVQWNITDEVATRVYRHFDVVDSTAFHPSGRYLFSGGWAGRIVVWDAIRGERIMKAHGGLIQLHKDGTHLAVAGGGDRLMRYRFRNGPVYRSIAVGDWSGIALHPSEPWVAVYGGSGTTLFNRLNMAPVSTIAGATHGLVFSPDGEALYVSQDRGLVRYPIDYATGKGSMELTIGESSLLWNRKTGECCSAPAANRIVTASPTGEGLLIDLARNRQRFFSSHDQMKYVSIHPSGSFIATGPWRSESGTKVWNAETGQCIHHIGSTGMSSLPRFSPDGKWLVVGGAESYQFFRVEDWQLEHEFPRGIGMANLFGAIAFAPDNSLIALNHSRDRIELHDATDLRLIATLPGIEQQVLGFGPDGSELFVSDLYEGIETLGVWDLRKLNHALGELGLAWNGNGVSGFAAASPAVQP